MNEGIKTETFSLDALRAADKAGFTRMVKNYSGLIYQLTRLGAIGREMIEIYVTSLLEE